MYCLVFCLAIVASLASAKREDIISQDGGKCSLTFQVNQNQIQGLCQSPQAPQGLVMNEIQQIKAENAQLRQELDAMRTKYESMVQSVETLTAETATWREIIEWPLMDAVFKPDNETLYIDPDGPSYKDCRDAVSSKHKPGIYTIQPGDAFGPFLAYCDEEGWTVIQRRFDGSENFYREWADYQRGFGRLSGEMWLGLENIFLLTNQETYDLRVEVLGYNGKMYNSESPGFKLSGEKDDYVLHIDNMTSGNFKDLMAELNGLAFTTSDRDNDLWHNENCASYYRGAFWLQNCGWDLNREYCDGRGCMAWGDRPAKKSIMKIRPSSARSASFSDSGASRKPKNKNKPPKRL